MKLAVLSESPADEAAIRILVNAVLGVPAEPVQANRFRYRGGSGGWQSALNDLPQVIQGLHFHSDASMLAVVLDSDRSPIHEPEHDQPGKANRDCRLCQLRGLVARVQQPLLPRYDGSRVLVACGLAVPEIEAWY